MLLISSFCVSIQPINSFKLLQLIILPLGVILLGSLKCLFNNTPLTINHSGLFFIFPSFTRQHSFVIPSYHTHHSTVHTITRRQGLAFLCYHFTTIKFDNCYKKHFVNWICFEMKPTLIDLTYLYIPLDTWVLCESESHSS